MKFLYIFLFLGLSCANKNWRQTSRESVGLAPKTSELKEDIFQVYYARAFSWRGYFGVHPWVAWKKTSDQEYTVAQVTSWNLRRQGTSLSVTRDLPDRKWYGRAPTLLFEVRGKKASEIISQAENLIEKYPYRDQYRIWPGPNSNTFVAYLINHIDGLKLELPPHAIGKDFALARQVVGKTASSTGVQLTLYGLLGFELGLAEGVEVNVLGLHFGLDLWPPALKLPIIGRLGFADKPL